MPLLRFMIRFKITIYLIVSRYSLHLRFTLREESYTFSRDKFIITNKNLFTIHSQFNSRDNFKFTYFYRTLTKRLPSINLRSSTFLRKRLVSSSLSIPESSTNVLNPLQPAFTFQEPPKPRLTNKRRRFSTVHHQVQSFNGNVPRYS